MSGRRGGRGPPSAEGWPEPTAAPLPQQPTQTSQAPLQLPPGLAYLSTSQRPTQDARAAPPPQQQQQQQSVDDDGWASVPTRGSRGSDRSASAPYAGRGARDDTSSYSGSTSSHGDRGGYGSDRGRYGGDRGGGSDRGGRGGYGSSSEYSGSARGGGSTRGSGSRYGGGGGYSGGGRSQSAGGGGRSATLDTASAVASVHEIYKRCVIRADPLPKLEGGHVRRPGFGELGEKVGVLANHFHVDYGTGLVAEMYDVDIIREGMPRDLRQQQQLEGQNVMPERNKCFELINRLCQAKGWKRGDMAYDGQKLLYVPKGQIPPLPGGVPALSGTHKVDVSQTLSGYTVGGGPNSAPVQQKAATFEIKLTKTGERDIGAELTAYYTNPESNNVQREQLQSCLQALDVALRQGAANDPASRVVGRGFFWPENKIKLGLGTEAWSGYTQTLALTQNGLSLVLDSSKAAMAVPQPLIGYMMQILGVREERQLSSRPLAAQQIQQLNKGVERMAITVRNFTKGPASTSEFELQDGSKTTVERFFKEQYKIQLKYPNLPCANVGRGDRVNWLPVEFCNVVTGSGRRGMSTVETSEMIKAAAEPPGDRQAKIMRMLLNKGRFTTDPVAQAFRLKMPANPTMTAVRARVLPSPRLEYGKGRSGAVHMDPGNRGEWNLTNQPLWKPAQLRSYAVVSWIKERDLIPQGGGPNLIEPWIMNDLLGALQEKGIRVPGSLPPILYARRDQEMEELLEEACTAASKVWGEPAQLLLIVQERAGQAYNGAKHVCDSILGVQCQCLIAPKMGLGQHAQAMRGPGKKLAGLALKINTKLGGDNMKLTGDAVEWCPLLKGKRVMIMGADVTHAAAIPMSDGPAMAAAANGKLPPEMPSIAAVVASIDLDCTRYAARVLQQPPLKEEILEMQGATEELLDVWMQRNSGKTRGASSVSVLPEVIVMFRDGVSDGQFVAVLEIEAEAIRRACVAVGRRLNIQYEPKITFSTVQKRHQTRIFPDPKDPASMGPANNIRPGLVVDTTICNPTAFDFYLNSHAGIQGTNKAAKYHVLLDENNFSADSFQMLCHWLCFTFCRCTRSVSYCTPAYYAHHAAFRARSLLRRFGHGIDDGGSSSSAPSFGSSGNLGAGRSSSGGLGTSSGRTSSGGLASSGSGNLTQSTQRATDGSTGASGTGPGSTAGSSIDSGAWTMARIHPNIINEMYFI